MKDKTDEIITGFIFHITSNWSIVGFQFCQIFWLASDGGSLYFDLALFKLAVSKAQPGLGPYEYSLKRGTGMSFGRFVFWTIDAEDPRINGWFETQDRAVKSNLRVTMSDFCDYVLRQVICTSTTRKAAWLELDSLYKC